MSDIIKRWYKKDNIDEMGLWNGARGICIV